MKWPMLTRRGVTYYHRQVVPLALRPLLDNRREICEAGLALLLHITY